MLHAWAAKVRDVRAGIVYMLLSCCFFAVMAICVAFAQRDVSLDPAMTSAVRATVSAVLLVGLVRGDLRLLLGDGRPALWVRGFAGGAALLTYFYSLSSLGVGEAAFLNQTSGLWVALLAPLVVGEPTFRWVWIAGALSLTGMGLLAHPRHDAELAARLLGLSSGVAAAVAYLAIRAGGRGLRAETMIFYFSTIGAALSLVLVVVRGAGLPRAPETWGWMFGAGAFATLGQLTMTRAYLLAPAAPMAATSAAGPLIAALLGWWWLDQSPDVAGMVGMALIFLASVLLPLLSDLAASRPPAESATERSR